MNKKAILPFFLIAMLVFLAACNNKAVESNQQAKNQIKDGGSIVFAIGSDPKALNPLYASDRVTMTVNNALYAPLLVLRGNEIQYFLAEDVLTSEDYLTYTVKLKESLKWHDGQALTADDLVFTMEQILDEKQNSFLRDLFLFEGKAVAVSKMDDSTVKFQLPKRTAAFMASLEQVIPIPKHIFEGETDIAKSVKNAQPIGSGPFKFKEMKSGESITLERFDDYFAGKPHLDMVVYRVIADANAANIALQNGELGARYIEPKDVERFKNNENFNVVTYSEGMLNNMTFNLNNKLLQNKDVRQAIAYGINKGELVRGAYLSEDYAASAYTILIPDTLYYTEDVIKFDYDTAKAKELMGKAMVQDLKLKLAYINSNKAQETQGLIIQQQMKDIGVNVELLPLERGAFYEKLLNPKNTDFDLAFNGYVMGVEPDSYKSLFMTGQMYNFMQYSDVEVDALWNKGAVETDLRKREEIYKILQQKIIEDMVVYPITYPKSIVAIHKKYGGIEEAKAVPIFMFRDLSKLYIVE